MIVIRTNPVQAHDDISPDFQLFAFPTDGPVRGIDNGNGGQSTNRTKKNTKNIKYDIIKSVRSEPAAKVNGRVEKDWLGEEVWILSTSPREGREKEWEPEQVARRGSTLS